MAAKAKGRKYRFSFGPWNIHEGADPFGPEVRKPLAFAKKLKVYKKLGFYGVQFHAESYTERPHDRRNPLVSLVYPEGYPEARPDGRDLIANFMRVAGILER